MTGNGAEAHIGVARGETRLGGGTSTGEPDVLVVGGGPAGSTVAALLARRGWRVRLLERCHFPRPKPCGECLNPGAVATLERLGLLEVVLRENPAVLEGWEVRTERGAGAFGRFGSGAPAGLALPRDRLDLALLEAARRDGVEVEEGFRVESVRPGDPDHPPTAFGRRPGTARRDPVEARPARVIVGADGLRSRVARSLGALRRGPRLRKVSFTARVRGTGPAPGRGLLVLGRGRTVGVAPVVGGDEPALWNVTVVLRAPAGRGASPGDPRDLVLGSAAEAAPSWTRGPELVEGPWASGPFDWPTRRLTAPGVVLVGDAAGYFDPLTGQGMYRALETAARAALAIDRALRLGRVSGRRLAGYERGVGKAFRWGRAVQHVVEGVVSREGLREAVVGRLAGRPEAVGDLIRVTGDVRPATTLLRPGWWLPLVAGSPPGSLDRRIG